ncbi:hypothetical protein [Paractinoplanes globisporus]|uniref:Uncharacterized protein n=1 Tax=Paractinoplanes globisporus TaxID=113565 RepID=A0ABW6WR26_9ACTN|nr:hypothetical protein [Actinoplanes globisporus]
MKRSIRAWAASIGVVLMTAGVVALVAAPPAQAADSDTTLTFDPATGKDNTYPKVHTKDPCPAAADEYIAYVTGPAEFSANPVLITDPADVNLSHDEGFDVQLNHSLIDLAKDVLGLNAVPVGYYKVEVTCRDKFSQEALAVFSGYMHYYTATDYQAGPNVYPGSPNEPNPTPSTSTSTSAMPSATATTEPTDDPTDDPTTDPTETTDPTPDPTTTTSPAASSETLPVTGPPAGGLFALGVVLIILGGSVVLGTMRFDRPQPARW